VVGAAAAAAVVVEPLARVVRDRLSASKQRKISIWRDSTSRR
jgi:hypothetical protein